MDAKELAAELRALNSEMEAADRAGNEDRAAKVQLYLQDMIVGHLPIILSALDGAAGATAPAEADLNVYEGDCPDQYQPDARDEHCPACQAMAPAEGRGDGVVRNGWLMNTATDPAPTGEQPGKLTRDESTTEKREWWRKVCEAAAGAPVLQTTGEQRRCERCSAPIEDHAPLDAQRCAAPTEPPATKIKIDISDPHAAKVWETAQQARAEVESWPAWKRGEPPAGEPGDGELELLQEMEKLNRWWLERNRRGGFSGKLTEDETSRIRRMDEVLAELDALRARAGREG